MDSEVKKMMLANAEADTARLKAKGWTQDDFAKALNDLLNNIPSIPGHEDANQRGMVSLAIRDSMVYPDVPLALVHDSIVTRKEGPYGFCMLNKALKVFPHGHIICVILNGAVIQLDPPINLLSGMMTAETKFTRL